MPNSATVLVQLDAPALGLVRCDGWRDVAAVAPLQIAIVSDAGALPAIAEASRELFDAVNGVLGSSGGIATPAPCAVGTPLAPYVCKANSNPLAKRFLVYVTDGSTALDAHYLSWVTSGAADAIPMVPHGALPASALPTALRGKVALFFDPTRGGIASCASAIISRITEELGGKRIFISYRHDEAAAVAEQIFDALTHRTYDVFLDRFRGQPGIDFMERIREELVAKRCVVVLETPGIRGSTYAIGEVATAKRYRLGLIAVDLPGSLRVFRDVRARIDLRGAAGFVAGNPASTLNPVDLGQVLADINHLYVPETSRRWRYQRSELQRAAHTAHLTVSEPRPDVFEIAGTQGSAACMASVLPLSTAAFKRMDDLRTCATAVLFGPLSAQGSVGQGEADWLTRKTGLQARDEGRMLRSLRRFARSGNL